jgi:hypothetical protein
MIAYHGNSATARQDAILVSAVIQIAERQPIADHGRLQASWLGVYRLAMYMYRKMSR